MPVYRWQLTAAPNATADPNIGYSEGQSPSSLNDSARAAMAAIAQYAADISGATVTTGISTAYILNTNSDFTSTAYLGGQMVAFTPHVTNGLGPVTMTVDSNANLPLRSSPGVELPAGVLIQGTPYIATYNATDNALYLQSFYGASPYLVPLGAGMDFWGTTAPNSSFAFPIGQAISRTTYATLFAIMGTTYGPGDGSTTFNLPDKTGRVSAMKEAAVMRLTAAGFTGNSTLMGATGGAATETLVTANLPPYTPAGMNSTASSTVSDVVQAPSGLVSEGAGGGANTAIAGTATTSALTIQAQTFTGTAQGGTSTPIATVQPTIICNYIIRII
jgi:microcystin-dependent protein